MNAAAYLDTVLSIWAETHQRTSCSIQGDSMGPLIRHGDRLLIEHGSGPYRRGDVVVVKRDGRFLAHRLVRVERTASGPLLYTMGDRSRRMDPPVTPDRIQGRVIEARGSDGRLDLTSRFWRSSGRLVAAVSCAAANDGRAGTCSGAALKLLRELRSRLLPAGPWLRSAIARVLRSLDRRLSFGGR